MKETKDVAEGCSSQRRPKVPNIDKIRLVEFLNALKQLSRLQQEASDAKSDARQEMREVGLKRSAVWTSDAAFMREVQTRTTTNTLDDLKELSTLTAQCQTARDGLGPLEQEGIEAEQRWEGSFCRSIDIVPKIRVRISSRQYVLHATNKRCIELL